LKKLISSFVLCALVGSASMAWARIDYYDSSGRPIGHSQERQGIQIIENPKNNNGAQWGTALGTVAGIGANIFGKKDPRDERIKFANAQVKATLKGYNRENHDDFMTLVAQSPDLSYSLKCGLISVYSDYRQGRDNLDASYNAKYLILAESLANAHEASLSDLLQLMADMNPHSNQKKLKESIQALGLSPNLEQELNGLIQEYYKDRLGIDQWLAFQEEYLITDLTI
jgi:hypothetical protein